MNFLRKNIFVKKVGRTANPSYEMVDQTAYSTHTWGIFSHSITCFTPFTYSLTEGYSRYCIIHVCLCKNASFFPCTPLKTISFVFKWENSITKNESVQGCSRLSFILYNPLADFLIKIKISFSDFHVKLYVQCTSYMD